MGAELRARATRQANAAARAQALSHNADIQKSGRVRYDEARKKFVASRRSVASVPKTRDNLNTIRRFKQLLNSEQKSKEYKGIEDLAAGDALDKLVIHQPRQQSADAKSEKPAMVAVGAKSVSGTTFEHIKNRFRNYNKILDTTKKQLMADHRFQHLPPGVIDRIVCSIDMKALAESPDIQPPDLTGNMPMEEMKRAEAAHQYALNGLVHDVAFKIADAVSRPYTMQSRKHPVLVQKDDGTKRVICRGHYLSSKALWSLDIAAVTKRLTRASATGGVDLQNKALVQKEFRKAFVKAVRDERNALKEENFKTVTDVLGTRTDEKDVIGQAVTDRLRLNGAGFALAATGTEPYLKAPSSYRAAMVLDESVKDDAGFDAETATAKNFEPEDDQLDDTWTKLPLDQKDVDSITNAANRYIDDTLAQWAAHNQKLAKENPLLNDYIDKRGQSLNDEAKERARAKRVAYELGPADRLSAEELENREPPPVPHQDFDPKTDPSPRNAQLVETLIAMEPAGKSAHDGKTVIGLFQDLQACGDDCARLQQLPDVADADTEYLLALREQSKTWSNDADTLRHRLETAHKSDVCKDLTDRDGSPAGRHISDHYDKTLYRSPLLKADITRLQQRIDAELAGRPEIGQIARLRAKEVGLKNEVDRCGLALKAVEQEPIEEMDGQSAMRLNTRVFHYTKRLLNADAEWKKAHQATDGSDEFHDSNQAQQALAKRIIDRANTQIERQEKAD